MSDSGFISKLDSLLNKYNEIQEKLNDSVNLEQSEVIQLSKDLSDLEDIITQIKKYKDVLAEIEDLEEMVAGEDKEMKDLAEEELPSLKKQAPILAEKIKFALLPKDEADEKNAILEIRAGTGGEEAALFAGNLFRMYQRYADKKGWKFEIMEISDTGIGGIKEVVASISGKSVFAQLKFESGVHRVQRVPETESSGRIHTSAATVAVLPEAEDIDIKNR